MSISPRQLARALEVLNQFPDDYSKAAKEINCTRVDLMAALEKHPGHQETKDVYLDSVTSSYKNWVRGILVAPDFNGAHALKILERERPEIWSAKIDERGKASDYRTKKPKKLLSDLNNVDFSPAKPLLDRPVPLSDLVVSEEDLYEFDLQIDDV